MVADQGAVAELLAALAYGERLAAWRARENVGLAPDVRAREAQLHVAEVEERNFELIDARLAELGSADLESRFRPFLEAFFSRTGPDDWVEAQTFHYVGDALVADFAEELAGSLDPVSAEIVRRSLGEREDQASFALEELTRAMAADAGARERAAAYARRIAGEALTQTRKALDASPVLRGLLGGPDGEERVLLGLLERHRMRLDRAGIEPIDATE